MAASSGGPSDGGVRPVEKLFMLRRMSWNSMLVQLPYRSIMAQRGVRVSTPEKKTPRSWPFNRLDHQRPKDVLFGKSNKFR